MNKNEYGTLDDVVNFMLEKLSKIYMRFWGFWIRKKILVSSFSKKSFWLLSSSKETIHPLSSLSKKVLTSFFQTSRFPLFFLPKNKKKS